MCLLTESTQAVQALQHPTGEGPVSSNKEVEIRSLKSEIDILKKQIAGQNFSFFHLVKEHVVDDNGIVYIV